MYVCQYLSAHLNHGHPVAIKYALAHELLDFFVETIVEECSLGGDLRHQSISLLLVCAFLEKYLCRLGEDDADEELDHLATEIRGRCMQKVVVDVREHTSAGTTVVEGSLETLGVRTVLGCGDGRVCGGYLEDDASLLVRNGGLCRELACECVAPWEVDTDLRESQLEQLELAEVLVQQITPYKYVRMRAQ